MYSLARHTQRPEEDARFSLELEAQVVANYPVFREISGGKNGHTNASG